MGWFFVRGHMWTPRGPTRFLGNTRPPCRCAPGPRATTNDGSSCVHQYNCCQAPRRPTTTKEQMCSMMCPPPGVAPNVFSGSRECGRRTPLQTLVLVWWCGGGAVDEHTTHRRGSECTLCCLILQAKSFTLSLDRKFDQL